MVTQRRQRVQQILVIVAVAAAALLPAGTAGAWPGDPDGTYGACGTMAFDILPGTASAARAVALQADGKTVVAGYSDDRGLVMRLSAGQYDAGFATLGRARITHTGVTRYFAVAPTVGGGVVAAGTVTNGATIDSVVDRLTPAGALDTTFNTTGKLAFDAGGPDGARAVVSLGDGSVLVAGNATAGGYVAKFTPAGAPDTGWDGDGRKDGLAMTVRAVATRADGSVYVAGSTTASPADWRVLRLASDGSVDTAFGGANGATVDLGGDDVVTAIAVQPDGKVVATGFGKGATGHGQTFVRRFLDDATMDSSFTAYHDAFGVSDTPAALTLQADGRVVIAVNSGVGTDNDIVVARLGSDGVPDDSFGVGGVSIADAGRRSSVSGVVVTPDGRSFAVGSVWRNGHDVVGIFRYQDDASTLGTTTQGVVVDGFGGLHGWSAGCTSGPSGFVGGPYWLGWDIVRGAAMLPGGSGLVADGFGGLHGFVSGDGPTAVPVVSGNPYWRGWDIVRGVAVVPDGTGGYELDAYGGLHPFSINGGAAPPAATGAPYWGRDIARGVVLMPDGTGGYVVDRSGAIAAFGGAPVPNPGSPYWPGQDIVRGITLSPDGSGGWIVDAYGGLHPFGTGGDPAPAATVGGPYWLGFPIARGAAVLP